MKTGFICASGYNLVATATRNGRKLIAVVLGANSGKDRTVQAAKLLERGFSGGGLNWLMPAVRLGRFRAGDRGRAAEPARRNLRQNRVRTDHAEEEGAATAAPAA